MKQSEILPAVLAGEKIIVGEYRGFEARALPDGKNVITANFVLAGREVMPVETFAPKGFTVEQAKALAPSGLKLGDRVVVRFTEWGKTKFGLRANGTVEALDRN